MVRPRRSGEPDRGAERWLWGPRTPRQGAAEKLWRPGCSPGQGSPGGPGNSCAVCARLSWPRSSSGQRARGLSGTEASELGLALEKPQGHPGLLSPPALSFLSPAFYKGQRCNSLPLRKAMQASSLSQFSSGKPPGTQLSAISSSTQHLPLRLPPRSPRVL